MKVSSLAAVVAASLAGSPALASVNLVQNGGFETTTVGTYGQVGYNVTLADWTIPSGGYTFLFNAANSGTGVVGESGNLALWSTSNGGFGAAVASPDGGNFIAQDAAYQVKPLEQTINGLVAGQKYVVSFDWGAAQQKGFTGATTEAWKISLGAESHTTDTWSNPNHTFSGWWRESMVFTATGSSEKLSLLAVGGPPGVPPFSMIDGVSLMAAPEPATWAMMFLGFAGLGFAGWRKARKAPTAIA